MSGGAGSFKKKKKKKKHGKEADGGAACDLTETFGRSQPACTVRATRSGKTCAKCWCSSGLFFFFPSRSRHTRCYRDWSSDVCSSDLLGGRGWRQPLPHRPTGRLRCTVNA